MEDFVPFNWTGLMAMSNDEKQPYKPIVGYFRNTGRFCTINLNGNLECLSDVKYIYWKKEI